MWRIEDSEWKSKYLESGELNTLFAGLCEADQKLFSRMKCISCVGSFQSSQLLACPTPQPPLPCGALKNTGTQFCVDTRKAPTVFKPGALLAEACWGTSKGKFKGQSQDQGCVSLASLLVGLRCRAGADLWHFPTLANAQWFGHWNSTLGKTWRFYSPG